MNDKNNFEPDDVEGERGLPSVNQRKGGKAARGFMFLAMFLVLVGGLVFAYVSFMRGKQARDQKEVAAESKIQSGAPAKQFTLAPPPPPPPEVMQDGSDLKDNPKMAFGRPEPIPTGQAGASAGTGKPAPKPVELDKSSSGLMIGGTAGGPQETPEQRVARIQASPEAQGGPSAAGGFGGGAGGSTPLTAMLSGTSTPSASAGKLSNPNFTIPKGATIDCALQTRLDTTVPGMAKCTVTRDVFSANGRVVLIERGSMITGEYSSGLMQGQNRIFVLWTRVLTPHNVTMNLDSPGTDALGTAGLAGKVNNHFWKRFGAAMLLSVVDDFAEYLSNQGSSGTQINYGSNSGDAASEMADTVLKKTIDIPPTLTKPQGDRIGIFVSRDLYFGNVYALQAD